MSHSYIRTRNRKIRRQVGDVSKYKMIQALYAKRLAMRYGKRISLDNIVSMSSCIAAIVLVFSFPYDLVKKMVVKRKLQNKFGKH